MADRKVVCVQYETGKTVKRNGKTYPETKLLTVGSAFVLQAGDKTFNGNQVESWMIQGKMHAIPPGWDGKFILLDPLPRNGNQSAEDDVPWPTHASEGGAA